MKLYLSLLFVLVLSIFTTAFAGFEGLQSNTSLKIFSRINCGTGLTCTRTAKGTFNMVPSGVGVLESTVTASATTITAAQCGSTFVNAGAVQMELPEASTVIGCKLTFATLNASNFDVNPDNADVILVSTNVAGDAMRNATLGNTITIRAVSASQWVVVGINGTYTDIN